MAVNIGSGIRRRSSLAWARASASAPCCAEEQVGSPVPFAEEIEANRSTPAGPTLECGGGPGVAG